MYEWTKTTTYLSRFADAVTLLCNGRRPPAPMVAAWVEMSDDSLQEFAIANGPQWAQGIVLLDAAHLLAETPAEGVDHEPRLKTPNVGAKLETTAAPK